MISRQASLLSHMSVTHLHPDKIGPWKLGRTLGRGATGRVLLGVHTQTGQKAAVKVVLKSELHDDANTPAGQLAYGIEREIIIMKLLAHPNVLRLYDVWETLKALYLVLEYVEGGELFDLLVERGPLPEHEAVKYFRQIVLGTAYCHALGICHRDLKPENLLLDASLNVKLADFGMAALESGGRLLETSCGLPHYAAPEIVSGLKYHGAALDVWSCGVILFALLTGRLPFDDENIRNLLLKVQAGTFIMPPELLREAADLVRRMLTVDPAARIATADVLQHPLLNKYPIPNDDLVLVRLLPHPLTAHKLLGLVKNVDPAILHNLAVLWHDRDEDDIVQCLLEDGPNPEKTFYALLLRYRHTDDSQSPRRIPRLGSRSSRGSRGTPRHSRTRPVSFQRRYGARTRSVASSVTNLPLRSPARRSPARRSPLKSPLKRHSQRPLPRNIYDEIVGDDKNKYESRHNRHSEHGGDHYRYDDRHGESNDDKYDQYNERHDESNYDKYDKYEKYEKYEKYIDRHVDPNRDNGRTMPENEVSSMSLPPTLPSKDSIYAATAATPATPALERDEKRAPITPVREQEDKTTPTTSVLNGKSDGLAAAPKFDSKRSSMLRSASRTSKRKSFRHSLTTGLKRNSITVKLLSTYAKLSSESDWEYMDKQTKRTLATFATLCDKIFNHEAYDEDDERLVDPEEKRVREYERLMEAERRKHEAELRARRELAKQKRRLKRRLLLSLRKLHITVTEDLAPKDAEQDVLAPEEVPTLLQPKRQSRASGLRSISEGAAQELTSADIEVIKRRSATQPVRRQTPILSRRPVSRLDPLWTATGTAALDRAQDALQEEFSQKWRKRESMVSVGDGGDRLLKNSDYNTQEQFQLPEHEEANLDLSAEYMLEIRKLRLLNSQLNIHGNLERKPDHKKEDRTIADRKKEDRKTLISSVHIPKVTRKLSHFLASNKRLLVLTLRLTKESYRDLNSFLDAHTALDDEEDEPEENDTPTKGMPTLRTSFADRLDHAGSTLIDEIEEEPLDAASVMDLDEHLTEKRSSYYAGKRGSMLVSDTNDDEATLRNGGAHEEDYTFNDEDAPAKARDDVFDSIKLPQAQRNTSSHPPVPSMLIPDVDAGVRKQSYAGPSKKPYGQVQPKNPYAEPPKKLYGQVQPKKPLENVTNVKAERNQKRTRLFFRMLSWGSRKEEPNQLPSPADLRNNSLERKGSFFRWFSSSHQPDVKRYRTILPKDEMHTALFALLKSWSNFGLKDLRKDSVGYNITGAISSNNSFNMRRCKFRIKVSLRENNQKSELICAHVKGSHASSNALFAEIQKVLEKEGVMDS